MFWNRYMGMAGDWGLFSHWWGWILPLAILDLVLKALSLYRSARREEKGWFITAFKKTPEPDSGDELNADMSSSIEAESADLSPRRMSSLFFLLIPWEFSRQFIF